MQNLTYYPPCNHKQNTPSCSASFPHRGTRRTQVKNAPRIKQNWSHFDLAIPYKSVLLALGAPFGTREKVSSPNYAAASAGEIKTTARRRLALCVCARHSGGRRPATPIPSSKKFWQSQLNHHRIAVEHNHSILTAHVFND